MSIVIWPQQSAEWVSAIRAAAGGQAVVAPTSAGEPLANVTDKARWY